MAKVIVVGPGRVGTALAVTLQQTGHEILGAYCRRLDSRAALLFRQLVQAPTVLLPFDNHPRTSTSSTDDNLNAVLPAADMILVTVPDKAVTATAQTLIDSGIVRQASPEAAQSAPRLNFHPDSSHIPDSKPPIIAHTAGSLSADALAPLQGIGARCISMHPLQTIAAATLAPDCFRGITFTLDGEATAVAEVLPWIQAFGAIPTVIEGASRPSYHAAAALASNALVALAATAAEISGLSNGLEALLPLMRGAIENLHHVGLPQALTGPIERGDVTTVMKHLKALQDNPTAFDVYRILGQVTVTVASSKGTLTTEQIDEFRRLLTSDEFLSGNEKNGWNINHMGGM